MNLLTTTCVYLGRPMVLKLESISVLEHSLIQDIKHFWWWISSMIFFCVFPFSECSRAHDGVQLFSCPSRDPYTREFPCIDDHALCDKKRDCPQGEDENPTVCMFHKMVSYHLLTGHVGWMGIKFHLCIWMGMKNILVLSIYPHSSGFMHICRNSPKVSAK